MAKASRAKAFIKPPAQIESIDTEKMLQENSGQTPSEEAQAAKAMATFIHNTSLNGVIEQIAEDRFKFVNHEWAGARTMYPHDKSKWYVDYYFPYAKGGPLYVDHAKNVTQEKELIAHKKQKMSELGHRYLIYKNETTIGEALEQIA